LVLLAAIKELFLLLSFASPGKSIVENTLLAAFLSVAIAVVIYPEGLGIQTQSTKKSFGNV
jgi:hypothetical protein